MADNVTLNAGTGGAVIAADDIGPGVWHQRVKIQYGADGSATDVSDTNPLPIDDAGGSLTVDGTVTANLSATDNAVLDAIAASVAGTLTVGSHAVTNAGTFATQVDGAALTALQLIDNIVSVADSAAGSTPTGVAPLAVRDDSLSSLTPVEGDFVPLRVNSTGALHVTGGGGGTQYSVSDVAGSTDTVTMAGVVRDDALSTLTEADGDVSRLRVNAEGALWVEAVGAAVDDAAFTAGTSEGSPIMGAFTTDTVDSGDFGVLAMDASRRLLVSIEADNAGIGGGTQYTEDVATANPIVGNAMMMERDDALSTVTPIEGDWVATRATAEGALWVQDFNSDAILADTASMDTNLGTIAGAVSGTEMQVDIVSAPTLTVDLGVNNDVTVTSGTLAATQSGTWNITNVSGTVSLPTGAATAANQSTANTALQLIDNSILAHDAAVGSTQTNMAGARATNNIEGLTQVAANDGTRITADLNGVLVTRPHTTLEEIVKERVANTNGTSTDFTNFAAGGSGVHNYVTTISIYNSSATDGYVDFRDGAAGSVIFTAAAPATGGSIINFPLPLKGADNTALSYDVSGALDTVYISVVGFQAQG